MDVLLVKIFAVLSLPKRITRLSEAGDTLDDLRIAATKESVEITLEEELHIDCVKAFC